MRELIPVQTGAGTSRPFNITDKKSATLSVSPDLGAGQTVDIEKSSNGGVTFEPYTDGTSAVQLNEARNSIKLYGPMLYRVSKGTTVALGVYLQE